MDPTWPRNADLERAVIETRSADAYDVYADWLQSQGHPLGTLIALTRRDDPALAVRIAELLETFELPNEDFATYGLKWGLFDWVRIENQDDFMDDDFDVRPIVRGVFQSPLAFAVRELRVGVVRWMINDEDIPVVLEEVRESGIGPGIERLHLGDIDADIDMAHHLIGDVGAIITKSVPNVRELVLHAGEAGYGGLDLARLESLTIETCSLSKLKLDALLAAKLPRLRSLHLWFGSQNYGADCDAADLQPLLKGEVHANVTALGLMNAEFTNELVAALPDAPIAARLESLDLSMGTLDDAPAMTFAERAAAFTRLRRLDVSDNFLSEGALARVRSAFAPAGVEVVSERQKQISDRYPDLRYVTVAE